MTPLPFRPKETAEIGIIGGSGFYDLANDLKEVKIETPFGSPSEKVTVGTIAGRRIAFLPRHSKTHDIPPHLINYRANIWALYSLGVTGIVTAHACGSLQKKIKPGSLVVLDQFIDRTYGRKDTYFDGPLVTHVSTAYPYCSELRRLAVSSAKKLKIKTHPKGTVVVIQGPRFSTAAESLWFTKMGWDVVNMTQYPEVVLARELQICYCALAFPTDFDAGVTSTANYKPVELDEVIRVFKENVEKSKELILQMIKKWSDNRKCSCSTSLDKARI